MLAGLEVKHSATAQEQVLMAWAKPEWSSSHTERIATGRDCWTNAEGSDKTIDAWQGQGEKGEDQSGK